MFVIVHDTRPSRGAGRCRRRHDARGRAALAGLLSAASPWPYRRPDGGTAGGRHFHLHELPPLDIGPCASTGRTAPVAVGECGRLQRISWASAQLPPCRGALSLLFVVALGLSIRYSPPSAPSSTGACKSRRPCPIISLSSSGHCPAVRGSNVVFSVLVLARRDRDRRWPWASCSPPCSGATNNVSRLSVTSAVPSVAVARFRTYTFASSFTFSYAVRSMLLDCCCIAVSSVPCVPSSGLDVGEPIRTAATVTTTGLRGTPVFRARSSTRASTSHTDQNAEGASSEALRGHRDACVLGCEPLGAVLPLIGSLLLLSCLDSPPCQYLPASRWKYPGPVPKDWCVVPWCGACYGACGRLSLPGHSFKRLSDRVSRHAHPGLHLP